MEGNIQSSPYANVWKQDVPTSRTLLSSGGGTESGTVSGAREQKRLAYEKQEIEDAARRYSQDNMVPFEKAKSLMEKRLQNMRLQSEFQIDQETRNLQANNDYLKAQSELANISYTDKDALKKLSDARAKWSSSLAGTEHETNWAKSISSVESGVSNYQTAKHYENLDDPEKQAFLATTKAVAQATAEAPFKSAEEEAKKQSEVRRAVLQYAVKNGIPVSQATEELYGTPTKPVTPQGKTGATTPSMSTDVVTKIPLGSSLQISGGLGTPVSGGEPTMIKQQSSDIIAPIDESEDAATPVAHKSNPLTKEALHSLADELGPNASKESLMDLAKKRGYTF